MDCKKLDSAENCMHTLEAKLAHEIACRFARRTQEQDETQFIDNNIHDALLYLAPDFKRYLNSGKDENQNNKSTLDQYKARLSLHLTIPDGFLLAVMKSVQTTPKAGTSGILPAVLFLVSALFFFGIVTVSTTIFSNPSTYQLAHFISTEFF